MLATFNSKPVRWIIELDYDADPDLSSVDVREDVIDHLSGARGNPVLEGSRIIFDHGDDALSARLRFGDNVTSVITERA